MFYTIHEFFDRFINVCGNYRFLQKSCGILTYITHREVSMQDKPYYSPEEVAGYYDVTAETIRRLCREGKIPGAKQIGKQWRIPREYLQQNRTIPEKDGEKKDQ